MIPERGNNLSHLHTIIDHDKHFVIDPVTRKINPETSEKNRLIQYDHNSERYTFELPRYIEGHDMSLCDVVEIHYLNISSDNRNTNPGIEEPDDLGFLEGTDDIVAFSWLVGRNATRLNGTLSFAIRLACTSDGEIVYDWHTGIYSNITISNSINNGEVIVTEYADILEQWRQRLFGMCDSEEQKLLTVSAEQQQAIIDKGNEINSIIENNYAAMKRDIDEIKEYLDSLGIVISDGKICATYSVTT